MLYKDLKKRQYVDLVNALKQSKERNQPVDQLAITDEGRD